MQFKKSSLALAVAIALTAGNAYAVVDLSATPVAPAKFATEMLSANVTLKNADAAIDLAGKIGWGVAGGNHLYIRIDLTNGLFKTALTSARLTTPTVAGTTVSLSSGGGAGSAFVIFDVSNPAGLKLADTFNLAPADLTLVSQTQDITATVKFYTDSTLAATNGTALATLSGSYTTASPALTTTYTPYRSTALVSKDFKEFGKSDDPAGPGPGKVALLGMVDTAVNAVLVPATGEKVLAADLATSSNLVLTGNFGAVGTTGSIGASAGAECGAPTKATLNTGKTTATFTEFADGTLLPKKTNICFTVDGLSAIPAQTVTGVLSFAGQVAPSAIPSASGTVGTIVRDGTELQAPIGQVITGWGSRVVLTNTGTVDRPFKVRVMPGTGSPNIAPGPVVGGTIPAGQFITQDVSELINTPTSGTFNLGATVVVTVDAPNEEIQGLYQLWQVSTGNITNTQMIRPATN